MTDMSVLCRRALGAVCFAAIAVAPAACGGDDDDAAPGAPTTTTAAEPASCIERAVDLMLREDVVEAARTDADELPADAEAAFDALDAECGDELDAMTDADIEAMLGQVDPQVVQYLGEGEKQEFEKTGSAISG